MPLVHMLQIRKRVDKDIGLITLEGQLMAESRFDLEQLLREWMEGGVHFVLISCRDLKFIDSAGLSTLIGGLHRLKRAGGDLVMCEMNPSIESLFEVTTLSNYFRFFSTADLATAHLRDLAAERRKKGVPDASEVKAPGKPKPRTKPISKPKKKG